MTGNRPLELLPCRILVVVIVLITFPATFTLHSLGDDMITTLNAVADCIQWALVVCIQFLGPSVGGIGTDIL